MKYLPLLLIALAACDRDAPPAPTPDDTARLNEAEDMLNEADGNEKGPEASASDPTSNSGVGGAE